MIPPEKNVFKLFSPNNKKISFSAIICFLGIKI